MANMYYATHQLNQQRIFVTVRVLVMAALLIPLIQTMGINGAALAVLAGELCGFILQMPILNRNIALPSRRYMENLLPGIIVGAVVVLACWLISYTLKPSYGWMLTVGLCVLMTAYTLGGIWQFKQLKQLLQHGIGTLSPASDENPINEERII